MRRRTLLTTLGTVTTLGIAGCSEYTKETTNSTDTEPDSGSPGGETTPGPQFPNPQVQEYLQCDAQMVSTGNPASNRYTATIQNTGDNGNIGISLFWQKSENARQPQSVNPSGRSAADVLNWPHERKKELYFNSGERREIEFVADPPDEAVGYLFLAESATYGARIRNQGVGGDITVRLLYANSERDEDARFIDAKAVYIDEGTSEEVRFNTILKPNSNWEVQTWGAVQE